jgi:hypothetical protein
MQRRAFLASSLALACGDSMASRDKVPFGMPPWHMWGNTVRLTSNVDINGGNTASGQLLKISYKRPETWSFFFGAELLDGNTPNPQMDVVVLVDLIAGVGRTNYVTQAPGNILAAPGFVRFNFVLVPPFVAGVDNRKYTTVGSGPPLDDATPLVRPVIEWLPAQDIQAQVRVRASGGAGSFATVAVTGWVAPRTHIRPDWFRDGAQRQFLGGETDGT